MPAALIVPTVAEPPATPLAVQVTALLALPVTVAANGCVLPNGTLPAAGVTATLTAAPVIGTETLLPVTAPGPGCLTANWSVPACTAEPVTISFVEETKVVCAGMPLANACESGA